MQGAARAPLERIMGIEPTFAAWEAAVLPMNYIRICPAGVAPGHRSENGERVLTGHAWKVGDNYVRHPRRW